MVDWTRSRYHSWVFGCSRSGIGCQQHQGVYVLLFYFAWSCALQFLILAPTSMQIWPPLQQPHSRWQSLHLAISRSCSTAYSVRIIVRRLTVLAFRLAEVEARRPTSWFLLVGRASWLYRLRGWCLLVAFESPEHCLLWNWWSRRFCHPPGSSSFPQEPVLDLDQTVCNSSTPSQPISSNQEFDSDHMIFGSLKSWRLRTRTSRDSQAYSPCSGRR